MKVKTIVVFVCCITIVFCSKAQDIYISAGKVEYEKKLNLYSFLGDKDPQSLQLRREGANQFKTSYFNFEFSPAQTNYQPGRQPNEKSPFFFAEIAYANKVYNNLTNRTTQATKFLFDKEFTMIDTLLAIKWRLTNETRPIAGFTCRKAVGILDDSLYLVAFFAEDIISTGGPEGITGLPGLILGLAFPKLHATWFATKVIAEPVDKIKIIIPVANKSQMRKEISNNAIQTAKSFGLPETPVYYQIIL